MNPHIYKYYLDRMRDEYGEFHIQLYNHLRKPISAIVDPNGDIAVYAEVYPDVPLEEPLMLRIDLVATGAAAPPEGKFLGTVVQRPFVWHVYARTDLMNGVTES